jgi:hypothetical protein
MPNTLNLIEQVRRHVPRHTDYAIAKALEMDQSHLAKVIAGKAGLGPIPVVRLSEILQRDLRDVLVLVEEDKAKTRKQREFWGRRSPRIVAAIALAVLAFGAATITTTRALGTGVISSADFNSYTLCVVLIIYLTFAKSTNSRYLLR